MQCFVYSFKKGCIFVRPLFKLLLLCLTGTHSAYRQNKGSKSANAVEGPGEDGMGSVSCAAFAATLALWFVIFIVKVGRAAWYIICLNFESSLKTK